tara:strand:+ start:633 stop:1325 length:693 start_codon:yes stop_codon:yes gene_type:complete
MNRLKELTSIYPILGNAWETMIYLNVTNPIYKFSDFWKALDYWEYQVEMDLDVFKRFIELEYVSIVARDSELRDKLTSLLPVSYCEKLKGLSCRDSSIDTLEEVSNLKLVEYLDLSRTAVESLDCISHWKLKGLNFQFTFDSELIDLAKFTDLKQLNIRYGNVDLNALVNLKNLEYLNIGYCKIDDFSPLFELPNLKEIYLPDNNFRKSDLLKYKEINPECDMGDIERLY